MARTIALVFGAVIAAAPLFLAWHGTSLPRSPAPEDLRPAAASPPTVGPSRAAPASAPGGRDERAASFSDAEVLALLERLVMLDGVGALHDDALVQLVEQDLEHAVRMAAAIADSAAQTFTLQRLADFAAGIHAPAALAAADALATNAARTVYESSVFASWAAVDPAAVLAYVEAHPNANLDWTPLAQFDPYAVLTLMQGLGGAASENFRIKHGHDAALAEWAYDDPLTAVAYAEAIPGELDGTNVRSIVGRAYARRDRHAAWQWVTELEFNSTAVLFALETVFTEVIAVDVAGAVDMLLGEPQLAARGPLLTLTISDLGPEESRRVANAVLNRRGEQGADGLLASVMLHWVEAQPDEAFDWVIGNLPRFGERLPFEAFSNVVKLDDAFGDSAIERLPARLHGEWLADLGVVLARSAPLETVARVEALAGQPGYEAAFLAVIPGLAQAEPLEAARLIERAPPAVRSAAVESLASSWNRRLIKEAATWADGIVDAGARRLAVESVARNWFESDRQAAADWVLAMPKGAVRDAGLASLFVREAKSGAVLEERLLAEIDSDEARQAAVSRAVQLLSSRRQADRARELMSRFLHDPKLRAQAEALLTRAQRAIESAAMARAAPRPSRTDILRASPPRRARPFSRTEDESPVDASAAEKVQARRAAHAALKGRAGAHDAIYAEIARTTDAVDTAGTAVARIASVAATLRGANARRFVLEALEHEAAADGYRAFAEAIALEEPLRTAALERVGATWAERDPRAALAGADRLRLDLSDLHGLRFEYERTVLDAWARTDARAVAQHFETMEIGRATLSLMQEFKEVIRAHPDSARVIANRLPSSYRELIEDL